MVTVTSHGGGCCGILHISEFSVYGPGEPKRAGEHLQEVINAKVKSYYQVINTEEWECLIEAVLIDEQLNSGWRSVLEGVGFKEVNSFCNSNTGNTCHVFHLKTGE